MLLRRNTNKPKCNHDATYHGKSYRTCRRQVNLTVITVTMGNSVVKETRLFSFNSIQLQQHSLSYSSQNAQISLHFQETADSVFSLSENLFLI